jgi:hypothetical protein
VSSSRWWIAPCALVVVATAGTAVDVARHPTGDVARGRPIAVREGGYTSSSSCRACHPGNYDSWHASYHRRMTQVATPQTVIGDFDDAEAFAGGRVYRLSRRGDEFWVDMNDPDAHGDGARLPRIQRRIVMTTGSHHMQVYWYDMGRDDRMVGQLPVVYLTEDRRWVPRTDIFLQPGVEHLRSEAGRWNRTCIKCHTTSGRPRLAEGAPAESFDSRVAEFGIACEECHGPAERHARLNRDPRRRYASHLGGQRDTTALDPRRLPGPLASQVCGQCHGILLDPSRESTREYYVGRGFAYVPGEDLLDSRVLVHPTRLEELPVVQAMVRRDPSYLDRSFWSDGMVRVSGREYNGVIDSPCFVGGDFSCFSCHTLHETDDDPRPASEWANDQLAPGMDGDDACLQCHASYRENVVAHSHHVAASTGSRCANCHMPYTTYGLLKAIRSHQVNSPSVQASVATGRPNACNQCHLDRTLEWTSELLNEWYGTALAGLDEDERSVAASLLWLLRGDAGQRALMAWSMGWDAAVAASGSDWMAPYLAALLDDPYAAVRYVAARSLRRLPGYASFAYDYVGAPTQRHEAAIRAFQLWDASQEATPRPPREALLLGPQGLRAREFDRLIQQRDDRIVVLSE